MTVVMGILIFLMVFKWAFKTWPWDDSIPASTENVTRLVAHLGIFWAGLIVTSVVLLAVLA